MSKRELSVLSGLSAATTARVTRDLVKASVLREVPSPRRGVGRPSPNLELNGDYGSVLGISLGSTAQLRVMNLHGETLAERVQTLRLGRDPKGVLDPLKQAIEDTLRAIRSPVPKVLHVGVALSGQWNTEEGLSLSFPGVPDWKNVPIRRLLEEWTGCPVSLIGYAPALAAAEQAQRRAQKPKSMICVEVEDSVAMGILAHGEVLEGASGNAGEIGHFTIDPAGPPCYCGNTGCLEMLATCATVVEDFKRLGAARRVGTGEQSWTYGRVADSAKAGDSLATRLLARAATTLGVALATVLNLLNPEFLILSGPFFSAGDLVLSPLRSCIESRALPETVRRAVIEESKLGPGASALGAGIVAIRETLSRL